MKKVFCFLLCIITMISIIFAACTNKSHVLSKQSLQSIASKTEEIGSNGISNSIHSQQEDKSVKTEAMNITEIVGLLGKNKEEVIGKLGDKYSLASLDENVVTKNLFYYESLDIAFNFDENNSVDWIVCYNHIDVNGAKSGMTFNEIQDKLGMTEMEYMDSDEGLSQYSLRYNMDSFIATFISHTEDGANSLLIISKE